MLRVTMLPRRYIGLFIVASVLCSVDALAQAPPAATEQAPPPTTEQAPPPTTEPPPPKTTGDLTEEIRVIGVSPLLGTGIDANKVPNTTRVLGTQDLWREGTPSLTGALENQIGSINLNSVQGNPYQPDFNFRGFTASPVEGTPIGIAVYQNGVRVNEGFGDTVNWDLIPAFAIHSLNVTSANPVYGFNALGGAVAIELKNGFTYQGILGDASGGSFGRRTGLAEYGTKAGPWGFYLGVTGSDETGWRINLPSHVRQLHSDLGYADGRSAVHVSFTGADNSLGGTGPVPLNLLAQDYRNSIDFPGQIQNNLAMFTLNASTHLTDMWSLQSNFYYRVFDQRLDNGAPTSAFPCVPPPATVAGTFCSSDRITGAQTQLFDQFGRPVPLLVGGAFPGENDRALTSTKTLGGSLQTTVTAKIADHDNQVVVGGSMIRAETNFQSEPRLGSLDSTRTVVNTIPVDSAGQIAKVNIDTTNTYYGIYATDTFDLTPALSLTANARYNLATVELTDRLGRGLTGTHHFDRFNPGGGITYKITPQLTAFAGYAENNRVPTPAELSCASPTQPCTLASFFIADPSLKQVVSKTIEAGLRGQFATSQTGRFQWSLSGFRTDNTDDIISVASPIPLHGFFQNAGDSRRQGFDLSTLYRDDRWRLGVDYTLLDAIFQSRLALSSPFNPKADANGRILVRPGDVIPGLPMHRLKLNADYAVTRHWTIGSTLIVNSDQVLRGDESNQTPRLPAYYNVRFRTAYTFNKHWQLWGWVDNVTAHKYATFGVWTTETGLPMPAGIPALPQTRAYGPGAPIGGWVGLRAQF